MKARTVVQSAAALALATTVGITALLFRDALKEPAVQQAEKYYQDSKKKAELKGKQMESKLEAEIDSVQKELIKKTNWMNKRLETMTNFMKIEFALKVKGIEEEHQSRQKAWTNYLQIQLSGMNNSCQLKLQEMSNYVARVSGTFSNLYRQQFLAFSNQTWKQFTTASNSLAISEKEAREKAQELEMRLFGPINEIIAPPNGKSKLTAYEKEMYLKNFGVSEKLMAQETNAFLNESYGNVRIMARVFEENLPFTLSAQLPTGIKPQGPPRAIRPAGLLLIKMNEDEEGVSLKKGVSAAYIYRTISGTGINDSIARAVPFRAIEFSPELKRVEVYEFMRSNGVYIADYKNQFNLGPGPHLTRKYEEALTNVTQLRNLYAKGPKNTVKVDNSK